jgi:predicted dehydrogenase
LNVLVVGYGSIGKRHIENLSIFSNLQIFVCTNRKYDSFLKNKKCKIFTSLDDCIKQKPDIAFIANTTNLHVKTAIKLANANIPLFIEKPLSNSTKDIKILLNIIKKKKLVTMMGCVLRFHPAIKKIKEIISENKIGQIISVHAENGSFLPNWHLDEDYKKSYASRNDLGGGVVLTNIHELDYLYWFFGNVNEVFSITGKFSDLEIDVEDLSSILLRFTNNIIAEIHLDYFQKPSIRSCKIVGTQGTVYWDSNINNVQLYNVKKKKWVDNLKLKNYDLNDMYMDEIKYFFKCVNKEEKSINSIEEGAKILNIAIAIKKSSKLKKMVMIN